MSNESIDRRGLPFGMVDNGDNWTLAPDGGTWLTSALSATRIDTFVVAYAGNDHGKFFTDRISSPLNEPDLSTFFHTRQVPQVSSPYRSSMTLNQKPIAES